MGKNNERGRDAWLLNAFPYLFGGAGGGGGDPFAILDLNVLAANKIDGTPPDIAELVDTANGYNFTQWDAARRAHWNDTDETADENGTGMYQDSTTLATAIKADTAGMFTMFIRNDRASGAQNHFLSNWQNNNMQIAVQIGTTDKLKILFRDSTKGNNVIGFANILPIVIGGWLKIQIGSNGTNYIAIVNGITQNIEAGIDNGDWFGDLTTEITKVSLGVYWGGAFGAFGLRHLGYISGRVLTPSEISAINSSSIYTE